MTLACALSSSGPGWMSLAIFGVPLLGILVARFIVSTRSLRRSSTQGRLNVAEPHPPRVPDFPLATHPELGADTAKQADDLVGV
jgi:hypothetical protein